MSRHHTYRVFVRTGQIFAIRLAARDEAGALARAERLWRAGRQAEFDCVHHHVAEEFDIDNFDDVSPSATCADAQRARWAKRALQTFSRETGSGMGEEGVTDLICDLGHYAHATGIRFDEVLERAGRHWLDETPDEVQS